MNFYNFYRTTRWAKFLLPVIVFTSGCILETVPEPPIDPIPEYCPNSLIRSDGHKVCNDGESCRFDRSGQISAYRSDPMYVCINGQFKRGSLVIDADTVKRPVQY